MIAYVHVKTLKVGINARILDTKQVRGWSRYTIELIRGLVEQDVEVVLLSDKPINQSLYDSKTVQWICQPGSSYLDWEQRVLPRLVQDQKLDVLHCPINYGLPWRGTTKKVLTLHDAITKSFYDPQKSFLKKWTWTEAKVRAFHWISQKSADAIITVSEHAKKDLIKYYAIPTDKIHVIYGAADNHFSEQNVKSFSEIQKKYPNFIKDALFYVGGFEDRKNVDGLLKAYQLSSKKHPLLVAGQGGQSLRGENVIGVGYVDDEDLPSLYYYSFAFIYPSLYEGFGLQAVEAMQMKKPVLAASNTSLKEVVQNESCLFDPYSTGSMAKKINWLFHEADIKMLSAQSALRALDFSWKKSVFQTIEIYQKVLKS